MDICYICRGNEGILLKTCINKKCTATTHSSCLEKQYGISKKCGVCKSDVIIKRNFNYTRLKNFLFTILIFVLHHYLVSIIAMGLNLLNPSDTRFNDITVINKNDIYSTNYIIIFFIVLINYLFCLISSYVSEKDDDVTSKRLKGLNDKYGKFGVIILLFVLEIISLLISHIIGYYILKFFSKEYIEFYTYKTFLAGITFLLSMPPIYLLSYVITWVLRPLSESFYDEQFGE